MQDIQNPSLIKNPSLEPWGLEPGFPSFKPGRGRPMMDNSPLEPVTGRPALDNPPLELGDVGGEGKSTPSQGKKR